MEEGLGDPKTEGRGLVSSLWCPTSTQEPLGWVWAMPTSLGVVGLDGYLW